MTGQVQMFSFTNPPQAQISCSTYAYSVISNDMDLMSLH